MRHSAVPREKGTGLYDRAAITERNEVNGKQVCVPLSEGNGSMRELLGGKGANLAEMTNLGMPVPQGLPSPPSLHSVL